MPAKEPMVKSRDHMARLKQCDVAVCESYEFDVGTRTGCSTVRSTHSLPPAEKKDIQLLLAMQRVPGQLGQHRT
eukprot:4748992-Amphidinium_carterae.2